MGIRDGSNERRMRNRFGATTNVGPHPSEKVCKVTHFRFFIKHTKLAVEMSWQQWQLLLSHSGQWPFSIKSYSLVVASLCGMQCCIWCLAVPLLVGNIGSVEGGSYLSTLTPPLNDSGQLEWCPVEAASHGKIGCHLPPIQDTRILNVGFTRHCF